MQYKVICVRDRAADVYGTPMFVASIGIAIRSFTDEINRVSDNNQLNKHPEDFDLYLLGTYDDEHGQFTCDSPRQIAIGKDVVIPKGVA